MRIASLAIALSALWLLLSGRTDALLLGLGAAACVLVLLLSLRMGVVDREGHPFELVLRAGPYVFWLLWQLVLSNLDVARIVLRRRVVPQPAMLRIPSQLRTELGRVVLANSITLTPGTVCIDVDENGELLVHALTVQSAEDLRRGAMQRRVAALEASALPAPPRPERTP